MYEGQLCIGTETVESCMSKELTNKSQINLKPTFQDFETKMVNFMRQNVFYESCQ